MATPRVARSGRIDRDLRAIRALAQSILDGDDIDRLLARIAEEARTLAGAAATLVVTVAGSPETMTVRAITGVSGGPLLPGFTTPLAGTLTELLLRQGTTVVAKDPDGVPAAGRAFMDLYHLGPVVAVPLATVGTARGALLVANLVGSPPFRPADIRLIATFAAQTATAIELSQLRAEETRVAEMLERERIARDLHDGVVQSLFGLGMTLRALSKRVPDPAVAAGLETAIERLDEAITEVRAFIGTLTGVSQRGARIVEGAGSRRPPRRATGAAGGDAADPITAIGDVARASLSSTRIETVLDDLLADLTRRVDASSAGIGSVSADDEYVRIRAGIGLGSSRTVGSLVAVDDVPWGAGQWRVEPLGGIVGAAGVLAVGRAESGPAFAPSEVRMIGAYAAQAAIALEFERVRQELRRSAVSAERDRIGRDLHELVIQLLFGIGLTLQGLESSVRDDPTRSGLHAAVDALDRAIVDLRRYVFDLEPKVGSGWSLGQDLTTLAASMAAGSGLRIDVEVDPAVADRVRSMGTDLIQIAREAITNVVRHGRADHCVVRLRSAGRNIVFEIIDDGRGIARSRRRRTSARPSGGHGLANIRARAETLGGEVEIGSGDSGGTRVRISFTP